MFLEQFPKCRLRRTRQSAWIRRLVQEHRLSVNDLIWPCFIKPGQDDMEAILSMPGVYRYTLDKLLFALKEVIALGIPLIALFPVTPVALRDPRGSEALNEANLVNQAVRAIKDRYPELGVMTDVALDPYTSHGHDGVLQGDDVDNDATISILVEQALIQARAGADVIAPSDMQDGRIAAIRIALEEAGFKKTLIMAYSAKYASKFYGPFRNAVGSDQQLLGKGKETYQQNPANSDEALREVALDLKEGADLVMVKPGTAYLDVLYRIKTSFQVPIFAYQVSGEYAMLQCAIDKKLLEPAVIYESLLAFKRAGADGILTYFAQEVAKFLA